MAQEQDFTGPRLEVVTSWIGNSYRGFASQMLVRTAETGTFRHFNL